MPIHHVTSYEAIKNATEVRLWEVGLKGGAWIGTSWVWFKHARCQVGYARALCVAITVASLGNAIDYTTVVASLIISPVPNIARMGVTISGAGGALANWLIFVVSLATYSWLSHQMSTWQQSTIAEDKATESRRVRIWERLHPENPHHGSL